MLFIVTVRDVWLILVGEHVGLEMNCPPGLSLPSSMAVLMRFNGIAHIRLVDKEEQLLPSCFRSFCLAKLYIFESWGKAIV